MKHIRFQSFILIFLALTLGGCKWIERHRMGNVVAQVDDKILYENDVRQLVPLGSSAEDSLRIVNQYIYQWATKQLLYKRAVQNSDYKDEYEQMVEDYRRQLYVHEYEQNLLRRRQTDSITDADLETYFDSHHDLFRLRDNYVKGMFIILPRESRDVNKVISLMRDPSENNMSALETYVYEKSLGYSLFLDHWQIFSELKVHLPLKTADDRVWIAQNTFVTLQDSTKTYILRITDRVYNGDEMPFEIAKPFVKDIMENGQRISTLRAIEQDMYDDGVRRGDIYLRDERSLEEQIAALPKVQEPKEIQPANESTPVLKENLIIGEPSAPSHDHTAQPDEPRMQPEPADSERHNFNTESAQQPAPETEVEQPAPATQPTAQPVETKEEPKAAPKVEQEETPQHKATFDFNIFDD